MNPTQPLEAWQLFTRLGEAQILLPLALFVVLMMVRRLADRSMAMQWLVLLAAAVVLTTATKVAFIGWGVGSTSLDFTGISGHAMFAAAVYPLVLAALLPVTATRARAVGIAAGGLLALMVGVSRVVVDAHSVSEVVAGLVLGGAVSAATLRRGPPQLRLNPWLAPFAALWLFSTPVVAPPSQTHSMVTRLALALSGHPLPYTREALRPGGVSVPGRS